MSLSYLLGVDFGGSSSKATLLCENGDVVATAVTEYPTYYPRDGWAEQDPDDSLRAFLQNVRKVLEKSGVSPQQIRAIALDGATHTAVLLDEHDRVIRPAIYWTDRRATAESDELVAQYNDLLMQLSYNAPSPLWTLPQLIWLRRHEPENFKRIHKVLSMKDYVRYRLNGDFVTDSIEAMGFMLLDARTNTWSPQLCALAGLDPEVLPRIVPPHEILSPLHTDICAQTGLSLRQHRRGTVYRKACHGRTHLPDHRSGIRASAACDLPASGARAVVPRHGDKAMRRLLPLVPRHVRRL